MDSRAIVSAAASACSARTCAGLLFVLMAASTGLGRDAVAAVTYDGSGGVAAQLLPQCTTCHDSGLAAGAPRQFATVGVDFNTYALSTALHPNQATYPGQTNAQRGLTRATVDDNMPPVTALSGALQTLYSNWAAGGYLQNASPTVTTGAMSSQGNTTVTLNGSAVPNGLSTNGYFQYGPVGNVTANSTSGTSTALGNNGSNTSVNFNRGISGLTCGTNYQFRAVASNSGGTVNGNTVNFSTDACDPPVIRNTSNVAVGASLSVDMSVNGVPTAFSLTLRAFDDEGGTLTWSVPSGPANGVAGFSCASNQTTSNVNCGITYTPNTDYVGADSFVVRVTDQDPTPQTDQVTINVNITADPPEIRLTNNTDAGAAITVTMDEDLPGTFNLTLRAFDQNGGTLTWTLPGTPVGTPGFSGNPAPPVTNTSGQDRVFTYTPLTNVNGNGAGSFDIRLTDDLGAPDDIAVTVNITPVNDAPVGVADPNYEVPTTPVQANTLDVLANDINYDVANGDTFTVSQVDAVSALGGSVAINGPGTAVLYTPPANFFGPPPTGYITDTFTYTVRDSQNATDPGVLVTVAPLDTDADTIVDHFDNCDNDVNTNQDNNDGDSEGDVCDLDDDNDGMLDTEEAAFPGCLDPFVDDAAGDCDGDGRNNGDEIAGGFDPTADDVAPDVTAPPDVLVDATGYLTAVELGTPSSSDVLEGLISPLSRMNVDEFAPNPCVTGEQIASPYAFRPGRHIVYWTAQDTSSNCAYATQTVDVRPLVTLGVDQQVAEGATARVDVSLNGVAPQSPVVVSYGVAGTAIDTDHDAIAGTLTINGAATSVTLDIQTVDDGPGEGAETVEINLLGATNAALGGDRRHTVTIVEGNAPPEVTLRVVQVPDGGLLVVTGQGPVAVTALVDDPNAGDTHSFDWSASDNVLADTDGMADEVLLFDPSVLTAGVYRAAVSVTDQAGGSDSASVDIAVVGSEPPLGGMDSDGDTTADNLEGFTDIDSDGVPDHLDAQGLPSNVLQTQTGDVASVALVETEPGLSLQLGPTALLAYVNDPTRNGAVVTEADVANFAAATSMASAEDPGFEHIGGIFDFRVSGVQPGDSVAVVLPLRSAIRANAVYRKFTAADGWQTFVSDAANALASASSLGGICPGPGDNSYTEGLRAFDDCVQLLIEDGGPNDADDAVNGVIDDPGTVAVVAISTDTVSRSGGSAALQPLWLLYLCLAALWGLHRVRV